MKTKIFVDAAANRLERIVNSYGKKDQWTEGYKVAVLSEDGGIMETFVNRKASNSLMAEAWAVLKAIEVAAKSGLKEITVVSDAISSFEHPAHDGAVYLRIAKAKSNENGLSVDFAFVPGVENPADALSRKVTVLEIPKADAGTLDDLISKCSAFGTQKTKLRALVKKQGLDKAWVIWQELSSPDFKIGGLQVSRANKPQILIERLEK